MENLYLNFFGVSICVCSENAALIRRITYIFRYFISNDSQPQIYFHVSIRKNPTLDPNILDDGLLTNGTAIISYSYDNAKFYPWEFQDTFLPPLQISPLAGQFLVLHGCGIRMNNQTVAFIAPSLAGKTTMVYHALKHGAKCITDDLLFIKGDQVIPYKKPIGIRDTNELALNDLRNKSGITPLTLTNPLGASTYLVHLDDLFNEPYYTSPSKINWIVVPDKNSYGKPHKLEIATFSKLLIKSICNSGVNGQQLVDNIFSLLSGIHGVIYLPTKRIDEAYHNLEEIISNNMS